MSGAGPLKSNAGDASLKSVREHQCPPSVLTLWLAGTLAVAVPFWLAIVPPMTDVSQHVLVARILDEYGDPAYRFSDYVEVVQSRAHTHCGFKLFPAAAARTPFPRCQVDRFAFDVEVLAIARRQHRRVAEVPVNWAHQLGSRNNLVVDSAAMFVDLWRIRRRLRRGSYD